MGMNLPDMFKSWSMVSTISSVLALVLILLLSAIM
jgi:H+/gluconate symporter-like permease